MSEPEQVRVAIVDYGLGNLFSVRNACEYVGMAPTITSSPHEVLAADAVILPGVGAFANAMDSLARLDLVHPLREIALSDRPLLAICLGMQLLMAESDEFGQHQGLGIIDGPVVRLDGSENAFVTSEDTLPRSIKVPQVGWNRIFRTKGAEGHPNSAGVGSDPWLGSPLDGLVDGAYMYFVHSFYTKPSDPSVELSITQYGNVRFCSSLAYRNTFACQFHPERSGPLGLQIYRNIAHLVNKTSTGSRKAKYA